MIRALAILLALTVPAHADDDRKSPPAMPLKSPALQYVYDFETNTRIGIEPYVMKRFGYRNGQNLDFQKSREILNADQAYRKGKLR
jgi:hypothetical protein